MSDLSAFRDHARAMVGAQHKPECRGDATCVYAHLSPPCSWEACESGCVTLGAPPTPNPACPGCVTDADRALWTRLADEADAWLARDDEEGLFDAETPVVERDSRPNSERASGRIGAQIKTAPMGALTPNTGASPTKKESTDG